ncbi:manganese-dependent inorganic pyrophosphatase [bacterium]|nr:manganese-dependent inorganic pyrophosphatase [bacterium]
MKTYTIGHKNPDTDSIVSAIAAANLFNFIPAKAGEINKETKYILDAFNFDIPVDLPLEEKMVVLVDHNSPEESLADTEELLAIYDHHKLGNPHTSEPINVRIETLGSTATLIAKMYKEKGVIPPKEIASILICAIMSDTLKFTSPTTTEEDKNIAEELNKIAQIDIDQVSREMFEAKSDISDITTEELLSKDYKVFDMAGKKVGIGVWETVNTKVILDRKTEILEKLESLKEKDSLDFVYFAAVDILEGNSELFIINEEAGRIATKAFNAETVDSVMYLKGVVSRKKQITPKIEEALK